MSTRIVTHPESEPQGTTPTVLDAALACRERGWVAIPLMPNAKRPVDNNWQRTMLADADAVANRFSNPSHNIGVVLGEASGGLIDADLDCDKTERMAPAFLPTTDAIFGRPAKPRSHYLYVATGDVPRTTKFLDPLRDASDGNVLLEVRGTGGQTMLPPSVHPSGEHVAWYRDGDPARVETAALMTQARALAAAALLARYWQENMRQDMALALAGGLLRAGWDTDATRDFVATVAAGAADEELQKRLDVVIATAQKQERGENTTGFRRLAQLTDPRIVAKVREWLAVPEDQAAIHCTDTGNAERMIAEANDKLRYCPPWRKWLLWTGTHWEEDEREDIYQYAKDTARRMV
ncbi:MAG: bifunctional DNA primase/polymerase, partial [Chloroflexia bacterium]|nr:bifunctional DNA primase/polymerase [Chloroflexia bacterium]